MRGLVAWGAVSAVSVVLRLARRAAVVPSSPCGEHGTAVARPVVDGLALASEVVVVPEPDSSTLVLLSMRRWDLADEDQPSAEEAFREWMRTLDDICEAELVLAELEARRDREDAEVAMLDELWPDRPSWGEAA